MVVFTMLAMYIGCDTKHDVLRPGTFPPSVLGCDRYQLVMERNTYQIEDQEEKSDDT